MEKWVLWFLTDVCGPQLSVGVVLILGELCIALMFVFKCGSCCGDLRAVVVVPTRFTLPLLRFLLGTAQCLLWKTPVFCLVCIGPDADVR